MLWHLQASLLTMAQLMLHQVDQQNQFWSQALDQTCNDISSFRPDVLIISLGVDIYENDPISFFKLKSENFVNIGQKLAKLKVPTLFIMEGGYAVQEIGVNTVNTLKGFENG